MKNAFTILALILIFTKIVMGENLKDGIPRTYNLLLSPGYCNVKAYDNSLSPNVYSGSGFKFITGYEAGRLNNVGGLTLSMGFANTFYKSSARPGRSEYMIKLEGWKTWQILARQGNSKRKESSIYLGPDLNLTLNMRVPFSTDNNFFSYDIATNLGITGYGKISLTFLNRSWLITERLTIPFISYLIRPAYTGPYPAQFIKNGTFLTGGAVSPKTAITSGKIVSLNHYLNINNQLSLDYPFIKNKNFLRFTYEWNFYRSGLNQKKALFGSNSFLFSFLVNI
jgi:hypothetical protein